jgi:type III pantothenate kinase
MNIMAIDIGNTNITIGLFLEGKEQFIKAVPGDSVKELTELLSTGWAGVPLVKSAKEKKKDGVIVASSVKPAWTGKLRRIVKDKLTEKLLLIGADIPLPMELAVKEPQKVGTDRVVAAAAAYAVVEDAIIVADFGTAITIDLVDDKGVFLGGAILPGYEASARALKQETAQLPEVKMKRPKHPFGRNTHEAIQCGLYYSVIGALEEIVRRYAEKIGKWPQVILTGGGAELIKDDCPFVDDFVPNLVVKGVVLAYIKYLEERPV